MLLFHLITVLSILLDRSTRSVLRFFPTRQADFRNPTEKGFPMPSIENYGKYADTEITIPGYMPATRTLPEWAEYFNLPYATVRMRYTRGHRDPYVLFYKRAMKRRVRSS